MMEVASSGKLTEEHRLDELAVTALKQSEFKPGTKDDKPVAVRVVVESTFTLKIVRSPPR